MSTEPRQRFQDKDMQQVIGWLLRFGVSLSMVVVIIGGGLYLYRHSSSQADYSVFKGVPDFVQPHNLFSSILSGKGQAMIQFGIILLIATPVLRVVFSAIGFVMEKDRMYTVISLVVLLVIVASMLSGHAG